MSEKEILVPQRDVVKIPYAKEEDAESDRSSSVQLLKGPPPPPTGKTSLEENIAEFNTLREQNLRIIDNTKERQSKLDKERMALEQQLREIQEKKKVLEEMLSTSINSATSSKILSRTSSNASIKVPPRILTPDSVSSQSSSLAEKLAKVEELRLRAEKEHSRINNSTSFGIEANISRIDQILARIPSVNDRIEKAGKTLGRFEDLTTSLHSLQLSDIDNKESFVSRDSEVSAVLLRPPINDTSVTSGSCVSIPEPFAYESTDANSQCKEDGIEHYSKLHNMESSNSSDYEKFVRLESEEEKNKTSTSNQGTQEENSFTALKFDEQLRESLISESKNIGNDQSPVKENDYQSLRQESIVENSVLLLDGRLGSNSTLTSNKSEETLEKTDTSSLKSAKKRLFDNDSIRDNQIIREQNILYNSSRDEEKKVEEAIETVVSTYHDQEFENSMEDREKSTDPQDSALVFSEYTLESTKSLSNVLNFNDGQRDTIERAKQLLNRAEQYLESKNLQLSENVEDANTKETVTTNWSEELKGYKVSSPERKKFVPFASTPAAFQRGDESILEMTEMPSTIFSTESLTKPLELRTDSENNSVASSKESKENNDQKRNSQSSLNESISHEKLKEIEQKKESSEEKFYPLMSFESNPDDPGDLGDETESLRNDTHSDSSGSTRYKDFPELFHFPVLTELRDVLKSPQAEENKTAPLTDSSRSFIPSGFLEEQRLSDVPEEEEVSEYFKLTQTPPSHLRNEEISKKSVHYISPCSRGDSTLSFEAHEKSIISDSSKFSSSIFGKIFVYQFII